MKKVFLIALLCANVLLACNNKKTQKGNSENSENNVPNVEQTQQEPTAPSNATLLEIKNTVKGYDTAEHKFTVDRDGTYNIKIEADNLGITSVLNDADGNTVIFQVGENWTGELKKGSYTLIIGLMRNAARKPNAKMTYKVVVKE